MQALPDRMARRLLALALSASLALAQAAAADSVLVDGADGAPGEDGESVTAVVESSDLLNDVTAYGGSGGEATAELDPGRGGDALAAAVLGPTASFVDVMARGGGSLESGAVGGDATVSATASGRGGFHLDLDAEGGSASGRGGDARIGDVSAVSTFAGVFVDGTVRGGAGSTSGRGGDAIIDGMGGTFRAESPEFVYLALDAFGGGFGEQGGNAVTRLDLGSGGGDIEVHSRSYGGRGTETAGDASAEIEVRGEGDGSVSVDARATSLISSASQPHGTTALDLVGIAEGAGDVDLVGRAGDLSVFGESRGGGDVFVVGYTSSSPTDEVPIVRDAVRGETRGNLALYQSATGSSALFHQGASESLQVESAGTVFQGVLPLQSVATAFNDGPGRATARADARDTRDAPSSTAAARSRAVVTSVGSLRVDVAAGVADDLGVESSVAADSGGPLPVPLETRYLGEPYGPPPPTVSGRGTLHETGPVLADVDFDLALDDDSDGTGSLLLEFVLSELSDPKDLMLSLDRTAESEGDGLEGVELALRVGGASLLEESFSSLSELDAFFDATEVALGTLSPGEDLQLSLDWQSSVSDWSFSGRVAIAESVPEPASGLLLGLALALACRLGRSRRS